jgi:hypothetical protein
MPKRERRNWKKEFEGMRSAHNAVMQNWADSTRDRDRKIEELRAELERTRKLAAEQMQAVSLYMMARSQLAITSGKVMREVKDYLSQTPEAN